VVSSPDHTTKDRSFTELYAAAGGEASYAGLPSGPISEIRKSLGPTSSATTTSGTANSEATTANTTTRPNRRMVTRSPTGEPNLATSGSRTDPQQIGGMATCDGVLTAAGRQPATMPRRWWPPSPARPLRRSATRQLEPGDPAADRSLSHSGDDTADRTVGHPGQTKVTPGGTDAANMAPNRRRRCWATSTRTHLPDLR
jgi:hypothetical protein